MRRLTRCLAATLALTGCRDLAQPTDQVDDAPGLASSVVVFGITDLGSPLGGNTGNADAVNDLGQITGGSGVASSADHAFVWTNGAVQDLGTLSDGSFSTANDINAHGQVVGAGDDGEGGRVLLWDNGTLIPLDAAAPPEEGGAIAAMAINDEGQFVGFESFRVPIGDEETERRSRALFWESKDQFSARLLGLGGDNQQALDISNAGVIVGFADTPADARRAVIWLDASVASQALKSFDGGFDCSEASGINELGQIVGTCRAASGQSHAAFWPDKDAVAVDLGSLGGGLSNALDINELGQIVGSASIADGSRHAALWIPEGQSFRIYDLGGLSGGTLNEARGINNVGRAVGSSTVESRDHAVAWTIPLLVIVDIMPGDIANLIKADGRGRVSVAVLTSRYFNAAAVDPATLTLGHDDGNETGIARKKKFAPAATLIDVDRDGDRDLVAEFEESQLLAKGDLTPATTRLVLLGRLRSGEHLRGSDAVAVTP